MKKGFYLKLAWINIQKNHRFFLPRILSETGLLACFYIALTLTMDDRIKEARGGYLIAPLMSIGLVVLVLLSTVLMLYINSFLMKQRTREFGVYNVLGMEKRHIGKVLFRENEISSLISVVSGLVLGIIFYKLCSLLICRLLQSDILLGFYYIRPLTLILSGGFFVVLDLFAFAVNRIRIARMKPVELLKSMNAGEKEPKVKWLMLVIGILSLGSGYYLAVTIENPVQALAMFLVAVILVMIGTYFLFVAGSIFVLKRLKANKRFYYQRHHMAAVAGLLYRMKQNAVGLASIAILATGVLIMVSTTVSLYTGYERSLDKNYPQDLYLYASYPDQNGNRVNVPCEALEKIVRTASKANGAEITTIDSNRFLEVSYLGADNRLETTTWTADLSMVSDIRDLSQVVSVTFITADEYNALTSSNMTLAKDEIAICQISATGGGVLNLEKPIGIIGQTFQIRELLYTFPISNQMLAGTVSTYGIVVPDQTVLNEIYEAQKEAYKENASRMMERIAVTYKERAQAAAKGAALRRSITDQFEAVYGEGYHYNLDTYWDAKENMLGMYGTLFFLGILLGVVFIFTTTLIIYYKQISEGYEDRSRFQIMEKIGMSRQEVKKTINAQVLLVFFLPLIVAAIHMAFAFPLLNKMLKLLSLYSMSLFVICTVITFAVFAVIYVLIYKATSRAYFRIVS